MKLQPITSAKEKPFRFVCINCGQTGRTDHDHEARADLAGTPFEAYYCGECARDIAAAKAKP